MLAEEKSLFVLLLIPLVLQEEVALKAALSLLSKKVPKDKAESLFPVFDGSKWSFPSNCPKEIRFSLCESRRFESLSF